MTLAQTIVDSIDFCYASLSGRESPNITPSVYVELKTSPYNSFATLAEGTVWFIAKTTDEALDLYESFQNKFGRKGNGFFTAYKIEYSIENNSELPDGRIMLETKLKIIY